MAAKKKPLNAKQRIASEIKLVECWCRTARADLNRKDRIDALDSMRVARKTLARASRRLTATMPEVLGFRRAQEGYRR